MLKFSSYRHIGLLLGFIYGINTYNLYKLLGSLALSILFISLLGFVIGVWFEKLKPKNYKYASLFLASTYGITHYYQHSLGSFIASILFLSLLCFIFGVLLEKFELKKVKITTLFIVLITILLSWGLKAFFDPTCGMSETPARNVYTEKCILWKDTCFPWYYEYDLDCNYLFNRGEIKYYSSPEYDAF